jgi:UrcA family protein
MAIAHNLLGAAVSVLSLACGAAYADTSPPPIGSHLELVRYNDLNLDQPRDVARLFDRVSSAADKVCGTRSFASHYKKIADFEICYKETVASAVAHINRPSVTIYFQQRSSEWTSRKLVAQQ